MFYVKVSSVTDYHMHLYVVQSKNHVLKRTNPSAASDGDGKFLVRDILSIPMILFGDNWGGVFENLFIETFGKEVLPSGMLRTSVFIQITKFSTKKVNYSNIMNHSSRNQFDAIVSNAFSSVLSVNSRSVIVQLPIPLSAQESFLIPYNLYGIQVNFAIN